MLLSDAGAKSADSRYKPIANRNLSDNILVISQQILVFRCDFRESRLDKQSRLSPDLTRATP
jgi:hypothetical protein